MNHDLPRTISGALLAGVLCLLVSGCEKKEEAPPPPPTVEVISVVQKDVPIYRDWVGTLDSEVNASITAQVTGTLVKRSYKEGTLVSAGQVLFQIDPSTFQATVDMAKGQLAEAQARKGKTALDVARYTPLAATHAISQQELDNAIQADKAADAQVDSAKAALNEAEINLGFTTIRSPIDGLAGLANVQQAQVGNLVGPSSGPLTTVTKVDPIRAYFSVSQQLVTEIQQKALEEGRSLRQKGGDTQGPPLHLILASGYAYPQDGQLRFSNNQVDVKTGTVRVVGEFPNPNGLLVPGMFTTVRAQLGTEKDALVVPQRAVTETQGRYLIAIVGGDNKVSIKPVTVGERVGQEWLIKGPVKAGDKIVAEGIQKVRDGAIVNPVPYKEGGTEGAKTASAAPSGSSEGAEKSESKE